MPLCRHEPWGKEWCSHRPEAILLEGSLYLQSKGLWKSDWISAFSVSHLSHGSDQVLVKWNWREGRFLWGPSFSPSKPGRSGWATEGGNYIANVHMTDTQISHPPMMGTVPQRGTWQTHRPVSHRGWELCYSCAHDRQALKITSYRRVSRAQPNVPSFSYNSHSSLPPLVRTGSYSDKF